MGAPMLRNSANFRQDPPSKKRGPYTPEPVQVRVIARHMNGQSNRQIAREERMDRETVGHILSQQEIVETNARQRSRLQSMGDKALDVLEEALVSDDRRMAVAVAMKIAEYVLPKGVEQALQIGTQAPPDAQQKEERIKFLGQMTDMMLKKSRMYDMPLPADLEQVRDELDRG